MSDLRRCVQKPPRERLKDWRVIAVTPQGTTLEEVDDYESAKAIRETIGGVIQCRVYGTGWWDWCPAKAEKVKP
jgi:hypothetical protein